MYKVMIVDDEIFVRIGLRSMIDWESIGFQIVGEAGNGEAAFEKFLALKPDLIFTDIKMPKKDGFWLIDKIREANPNIEIIVLTAYDDFSYVRKALKLQVSDYLLKAEMEEEQVKEMMIKRRNEMEERQGRGKKESASYDIEQEKELLLGLMLNKQKPIEMLKEKFQVMNITYQEYCFCLVQFDFSSSLKERKGMIEQDTSLLFACKQLINASFLERYEYCFTKQFGKSITCLLISKKMRNEDVIGMIKEIRKSTYRYFNISFKSINSLIQCELEEARKDVDWFYQATDSLFLLKNGEHIFQENRRDHIDEREVQQQNIYTREQVERLVEKLCFGQEESAKKIIQEMKAECKCWKGTSINLKLRLVQFTNYFYQSCMGYLKGEENNILEYQRALIHSIDLEEAFSILEKYQKSVVEEIREQNIDDVELLVQKAVSYVEKYYAEKLTLEEVANYVGISRYYFSNLFKKTKKIGFSTYLNQVRIEHAKKLIFDPKLSIVEVANAVGFHDQPYFSKIFKKYTGMTVTEFRETCEDK